jgi:DNA polymerase-3 subunit beta
MNVRIDKAALMTPLYRAQGAADQRAATNVIGCVHISAEDDRLVFSATDYEVTVIAEVSADVIEPGEALVSAKGLFQVVRALPEGAVVTLSSDANHRLRIEAGKSYAHLNGLSPDEFPGQATESGGRTLVTDKSHMENMLKRTLFSVSTDDSRPAITGVLFEIEPEGEGQVRLRMVSTDGHRLSKAERTVAAPDYDGGKVSCIIHRRGAGELQRLLEGSDPSLRMEFIGRNLVFSSDRTRLQVRQIDANFPDYNKVVPEKGDFPITLPRDVFAAAIRRVTSLGSSRDNILRLEFDNGKLSLEMTFPDFGDAHEEIDVDNWSGPRLKFGFNPKYLLDVCNVLGSDNVTLELRDQISPCLIQSDEEPGSAFVIMPMRL